MRPRSAPVVSIEHLHQVRVSIREHAAILREMLMRLGAATFRHLCADCRTTLEIVARFLALLELYREDMVSFEQIDPLGELTVRWTADPDRVDDFDIDEYAGSPDAADAGPPAPDDETSTDDGGEDPK